MLQPPIRTATHPSVRAMIDSYIAAGLHQRLPVADARLKPTPRRLDWDSLTPGATAAAVTRSIRTTKHRQPVAHESWPPMDSTIATLGPCQSAPGSSRAQRFSILTQGATLTALRAAGLRLADLSRYMGSGTVTLHIPGISVPDEYPAAEETPK